MWSTSSDGPLPRKGAAVTETIATRKTGAAVEGAMIRREGAVAGNGPTTGRTRKTITAGMGGGVIMVIAMAMAREEETTAEIPGGRGAGAGARIVVMKRETEEMAGGMGAGEDTMIAGVALVPLPVRLAPPPLRDPDRGAATKRATVARKEERMTRGSMTAATMPETTTTTVPTKGTPATKNGPERNQGESLAGSRRPQSSSTTTTTISSSPASRASAAAAASSTFPTTRPRRTAVQIGRCGFRRGRPHRGLRGLCGPRSTVQQRQQCPAVAEAI